MIIDMVLTIAVVAAAFRAVTELQLRIGYVCSSADGTFMPVLGCIHHAGTGMGCTGTTLFICFRPVGIWSAPITGTTTMAKLILPTGGQYIDAVFSKE